MKYICILLTSLFITSCASGPEAVAKSAKELAKCMINKNSAISQSEKKAELEEEYKKIDDLKQKLKDNCNEEDIKKFLKITNCRVKKCKQASSIINNALNIWETECLSELKIDFKKDFSEKCLKAFGPTLPN